VSRHEQFEEICAAASIGEASPEDLALLEKHASLCQRCRSLYADYLAMAARHFASVKQEPHLSAEEAEECLDSELLTQRFFKRAQREGITFSSPIAQRSERPRDRLLASVIWFERSQAIAAMVVVTVAISAGYYGVSRLRKNRSAIAVADASFEPSEKRIQELAEKKRALEVQVSELTSELLRANEQLNDRDAEHNTRDQDHQRIELERNSLAAELTKLREELAEYKVAAVAAQLQLAGQRDRADGMERELAGNRVRIADLNEQVEGRSMELEKERELLAMGHDVTDLMGARNLHIVDVVDTDARGKTRPAFGRIFFTEGKSLVFYAYDLNESKMQKANYQYRVWAKKERGNEQVQSLGIFYSDDKLQKRWVFKCNDPKILSEIDSVFVTLEPASNLAERPKGPNLMYAYLHGQPNHP
jgi:hypothetical protein